MKKFEKSLSKLVVEELIKENFVYTIYIIIQNMLYENAI